jgi:hypothetical protein
MVLPVVVLRYARLAVPLVVPVLHVEVRDLLSYLLHGVVHDAIALLDQLVPSRHVIRRGAERLGPVAQGHLPRQVLG